METCKVCGVDVSKDFWKCIKKHDLFRCHGCGVIFCFPFLDEKRTNPIYENNEKSEFEYYVRTMLEDAKTFNARLKFMERFVSPDKRNVLDFGCNMGSFLRVAKDRGWFFLVGCDLNKRALEFAGNDPYIQVDTFMPSVVFDVIHASDVVEHVPDPKALLLKFNEQVKRGGFVFLTTPDIGSLFSKILGRRWHAIKPPEHLFYFDKNSMRRLAVDSGFKIVKIKWGWRYRRVGTIIEHLAAISGFGCWLKKHVPLRIKNVIVPFSVGDEMLVVMQKC